MLPVKRAGMGIHLRSSRHLQRRKKTLRWNIALRDRQALKPRKSDWRAIRTGLVELSATLRALGSLSIIVAAVTWTATLVLPMVDSDARRRQQIAEMEAAHRLYPLIDPTTPLNLARLVVEEIIETTGQIRNTELRDLGAIEISVPELNLENIDASGTSLSVDTRSARLHNLHWRDDALSLTPGAALTITSAFTEASASLSIEASNISSGEAVRAWSISESEFDGSVSLDIPADVTAEITTSHIRGGFFVEGTGTLHLAFIDFRGSSLLGVVLDRVYTGAPSNVTVSHVCVPQIVLVAFPSWTSNPYTCAAFDYVKDHERCDLGDVPGLSAFLETSATSGREVRDDFIPVACGVDDALFSAR